jgi:hypothetical protein
MRLIGRDIEAHLNGQWIRGDVIRTFPEGALLRLNYGYTLTYKEVLDQFRRHRPKSASSGKSTSSPIASKMARPPSILSPLKCGKGASSVLWAQAAPAKAPSSVC